MLQKFKMSTFATVLCLFGFFTVSATPVFAHDMSGSEFVKEFDRCKSINNNSTKRLKKLMNCYSQLSTHVKIRSPLSFNGKKGSEFDSKGHAFTAVGARCANNCTNSSCSNKFWYRCLKDYYGGISRWYYNSVK